MGLALIFPAERLSQTAVPFALRAVCAVTRARDARALPGFESKFFWDAMCPKTSLTDIRPAHIYQCNAAGSSYLSTCFLKSSERSPIRLTRLLVDVQLYVAKGGQRWRHSRTTSAFGCIFSTAPVYVVFNLKWHSSRDLALANGWMDRNSAHGDARCKLASDHHSSWLRSPKAVLPTLLVPWWGSWTSHPRSGDTSLAEEAPNVSRVTRDRW